MSDEKKKTILEKGKILTNFMKVLSIIIAITFFVITVIFLKRLPDSEETKSVLMLCLFIVGVFGTVDISIIIKNFMEGMKK